MPVHFYMHLFQMNICPGKNLQVIIFIGNLKRKNFCLNNFSCSFSIQKLFAKIWQFLLKFSYFFQTAMHACQIDPTDTAPPCPGLPQRACVETKGGTLWGRQPFCPISPLLLKCADCATTLSLRFGIDQDLRPRW